MTITIIYMLFKCKYIINIIIQSTTHNRVVTYSQQVYLSHKPCPAPLP
jgi:hypothetical protein